MINNDIKQAVANSAPLTELDLQPLLMAKKTIEQAIECAASNDAGAPFEKKVVEALRLVRDEDRASYMRYRDQFKRACRGILITELDRAVKGGGDDPEPESIADALVALVRESTELFHDADNKAYAYFEQDGHRETWPLGSTGFSEWACCLFYQETGKAPRDASLKDAINTLSGIAKYDGEEHQVWLRVAKHEDRYYIDLCNDDWSVVEISSAGWQILDLSPVRFRRTSTMRPMPTPVKDDELALLWGSVNVPKDDQPLVLAWLLESLRPETEFPVLELGGEQGCGKSSTQSLLRDLIDPSAVNLRTAPKSVEDIYVGAANNWMTSFNNLSRLSSSQQDAFCTLSTGGGYSSRTLYTNLDETLVDVTRPVAMNGISTLATAQDLIDRTIRLELPVIQGQRQASKLAREFEENKPRIIGGLMDLFSKTLKVLPMIQQENLPRMADFSVLGEAMFKALGREDSFNAVYKDRRDQATIAALESSPVACALIDYVDRKGNYHGTVKSLLELLRNYPHDGDGWPKSPRGLGDALRRNAPGLKVAGILVQFGSKRHNDGIHVEIKRIVRECRELCEDENINHTDPRVRRTTDTMGCEDNNEDVFPLPPLGKKTENNVHDIHDVHASPQQIASEDFPRECREHCEHHSTSFTPTLLDKTPAGGDDHSDDDMEVIEL